MAKSSNAGGCLILIAACAAIGYYSIKGCSRAVGGAIEEAAAKGKEKAKERAMLLILDAEARKTSAGSLEWSFTIRNTGTKDAADFHIETTCYAPSGTRLDHKKIALYESVTAGDSRRFDGVDFGTVDGQSVKFSDPEIFDCRFAGDL